MNWNTLYITGKDGFEKEVLHNLEHSDITFMPGSLGEADDFTLYWISEKTAVRDFKKAIGGKTIFKYRLRFYTSLEEIMKVQMNPSADKLTPQEEAMIREMNDWQENQSRYKHSA